MSVLASGSKFFGRLFGGKAAAPKLTRQNAMSKKIGTAATPKATRQTTLDDFFGKKPAAATPKSGAKPATVAKPQLSAEDRALLDKMDPKQDLTKLGKAKDDIEVGTKKAAAPAGAVEPEKGGFWSNGLVQTIGGTVVGTLGVSALTGMFSGGGAEAAAAPAEAAPAAASSYDPYASSGSYGIPGSLPNYI